MYSKEGTFALFVLLLAFICCADDPMPKSKIHYVMNIAAVTYPEDWHVHEDNSIVSFSPNQGNSLQNGGPVFTILADSYQEKELGDADASELLDRALEKKWGIVDPSDLGDARELTVCGLPGIRKVFEARGIKGWFGFAFGNGKYIIVGAYALPIAWADYEPVFEAMLSKIRCE